MSAICAAFIGASARAVLHLNATAGISMHKFIRRNIARICTHNETPSQTHTVRMDQTNRTMHKQVAFQVKAGNSRHDSERAAKTSAVNGKQHSFLSDCWCGIVIRRKLGSHRTVRKDEGRGGFKRTRQGQRTLWQQPASPRPGCSSHFIAHIMIIHLQCAVVRFGAEHAPPSI
jgi:hypothetical protein